jgi:carbon storage regulator CsrA
MANKTAWTLFTFFELSFDKEVSMLVLSRNSGDSVTFPELNMAIEVLKVTGNRVQLGINAAAEIRVLRTELMNRASKCDGEIDAEERHKFRNRLNTIGLAMTIAQKHLDRGDLKLAQAALNSVSQVSASQASVSQSSDFVVRSLTQDARQPTLTVLLVEDNANERQLLSDILRLHGVQVHTAENGLEAIDLLKTLTPDAVLVDMHMPVCDGPTTIKKIRNDERFQSLPIFAVSGVSEKESSVEVTLHRGVDDWFQKPFQSQQLLDALSDLTNRCLAC